LRPGLDKPLLFYAVFYRLHDSTRAESAPAVKIRRLSPATGNGAKASYGWRFRKNKRRRAYANSAAAVFARPLF
jgi:hypothetical protein